MGNHNILITNPKGERSYHYEENQSLDACKLFFKEYGSAPKGWRYQIVNLNPIRRKYPECTLIHGFDSNDEIVDVRKAHVKHNNGKWYTPKMAKRDARTQGATWFKREKVWKEGD